MRLIIAKIGADETINFACEEFARYLKKIDTDIFIDQRTYDKYDSELKNIVWIGVTGCVADSVDDEVLIKINNLSGMITGSSERAVLIASYRVLYELGCRFLRPGKDAEIIPQHKLETKNLNIDVSEKASYRHRAVCIEGAVSYEHVVNMIDWLPKVGLNGYYIQFRVPFTFYDRWYSHEGNSTLPAEPLNGQDVVHMNKRIIEEITKRGLLYHAIGHGWTCEPFGISGSSWSANTEEITPEIKQYFAEVNGKRELWYSVALNTNLCYSNSEVRERMNNAIVDYCKLNSEVDYLHFWLADGSNNHCECDECKKMRPSDYYVLMLNELDRKLTAAGIPTKIVFLIYVDLLWEPEFNKIENPDRFVLMFAPITRTYSKAFSDFDRNFKPELASYERNKLRMPSSVEENIARLERWQLQYKGDSFDFDYHLMWDHVRDPGYYISAEILHKDMKNLDKIGLNGMVSCQLQRVGFPTGLPIYSMAKALWDKESEFDDVANEYFSSAFGVNGQAVKMYLKTLSNMFDPTYLRFEKPQVNSEAAERFLSIPDVIKKFKSEFISKNQSSQWKILSYHAELCIILAEGLAAKASGNPELAKAKYDELVKYTNSIEPDMNTVIDVWNYNNVMRGILCN